MKRVIDACVVLSFVLATPIIGKAQTQQENITSYSRPTIPLRESMTKLPIPAAPAICPNQRRSRATKVISSSFTIPESA